MIYRSWLRRFASMVQFITAFVDLVCVFIELDLLFEADFVSLRGALASFSHHYCRYYCWNRGFIYLVAGIHVNHLHWFLYINMAAVNARREDFNISLATCYRLDDRIKMILLGRLDLVTNVNRCAMDSHSGVSFLIVFVFFAFDVATFLILFLLSLSMVRIEILAVD